ncbi:MAG TPA: hypothetical protein VGS20_11440 [Candidatus Acidoferrales bacterium]|nr:hypothetical protein [Candidatus Acidoferrales bacterium]
MGEGEKSEQVSIRLGSWLMTSGMGSPVSTLDDRVGDADRLESVCKRDLCRGDSVLVVTRNSVYSIQALGDDYYSVAGGWFERQGMSPSTLKINGCTWGGSAIKQDIVAARGLFLEFGNRVVTTRIRDVMLIRTDAANRSQPSGEAPTEKLPPRLSH